MYKAGKLVVNVGSMFSGKSTELLRQGRRYEIAGKKVLYIKPDADDRYSTSEIVTHDYVRVDCVCAETDLLLKTIEDHYDAVLIDEGQFFGENLIKLINVCLREGTDVIVSGLDIDRYGKPFGIMPTLMAIADEVHKFRAVCMECGGDAWISYGEFEDDNLVVLGAKEKYKPLCRTCYYKKEARKL